MTVTSAGFEPLAQRGEAAPRERLLEGKRLLITGVLTEQSLAYAVAELAQLHGAEVVLTGAGRGVSLTRRAAKALPQPPDVLELDVADPAQLRAVTDELSRTWQTLDGVLHAIAFAPATCLGGGFLDATWEDVAVALHVSMFSLKAIAAAALPLLRQAGGGSIVALDFDGSKAWPAYDWMGVAKSGLESAGRYLARELGPDNVRVNMVAAGPMRTIAARAIPGFSAIGDVWRHRSPLGWDVGDRSAVARACIALFSDLFPMTTGEVIHVDGGFHAVGG